MVKCTKDRDGMYDRHYSWFGKVRRLMLYRLRHLFNLD